MKKGILVSLVVFLVFGLVGLPMAQTQTKPTATPAKTQKPAVHVFKGTIDSITLADPAKGTKSEIVVVDVNKKSKNFLILSTTTIYDAKGGAITLDKLAKGNEVTVRYKTTTEGVNEAVSVKLAK
jgi:hypothetical protein